MIYRILTITINLETKVLFITLNLDGREEAALISFDINQLDISWGYIHKLLNEYIEDKYQ